MLLQSDIKSWIIDTLKNDADYTQLCVDTVGSTLNFYSSSPMDNEEHFAYPSFEVYSDETMSSYDSSSPFGKIFTIPIAIAIEVDDEPVDVSGTKKWDSTDKVEKLAMYAENILRREANCGINNNYAKLLNSELQISEIGEATRDVQAAMWIQFGLHNNI